MRYKLRAWDATNNRMLTSDCVDLLVDFQGRLNSHDFGVLNGYDNTPQHVIMQFTGLHDNDGIPIYEGDIHEVDGEHGVVEWHDGTYFVICDEGPRFLCLQYSDEKGKVIGNIHENPELLEAKA